MTMISAEHKNTTDHDEQVVAFAFALGKLMDAYVSLLRHTGGYSGANDCNLDGAITEAMRGILKWPTGCSLEVLITLIDSLHTTATAEFCSGEHAEA